VLIDGTNGIIAGHGRVMAAQKLGEEKVPTIELAHLSEHQKRAYIIADNKLALNSGWDEQMLALEISDLKDAKYDLNLLGFSIEDIDKIIEEVNFDPATEEEQGKLDELDPKWVDCPHCGKEFDVRKN
jgi:ParB-like chromosome segregation protein Spo0J